MLGLTRQEQGIVLFLVFSLLVGGAVDFYKRFVAGPVDPPGSKTAVEAFQKRARLLQHRVHKDSARVSDSEATARKSRRSSGGENLFPVNVNRAEEQELERLPRVGPVLARRILDYRKRNGGFRKLEDLKRVKGIGEATFERIKPYVSLK
ncbi:MAG: helix-hairpin-helix domain-containing protein [Calditrichaeota bacterium]|nr:MAG: helix-hairpin-helix domain-containing protein [Calditrichota bacterium]